MEGTNYWTPDLFLSQAVHICVFWLLLFTSFSNYFFKTIFEQIVRRLFKIFGRAILLLLALFALSIGYMLYLFNVKARGEVVSTVNYVEVPYYYDINGLINVDVVLNGKTRRFIIDSGAGNMVFTNADVELDGFSGIGFGVGASSGFFFTRLGKIDSFNIGDLQFKDFTFEKTEPPFVTCSNGPIGIIGKEALRKCKWQFYPAEQKIRIALDQNSLIFPEHRFSVPLKINKFGFQPKAKVTVNKQSSEYIVDTGSNNTLSTQLDSTWSLSGGIKVVRNAVETLGDNSLKAHYIFETADLSIGGRQLPQKVTLHAMNGTAQTIGLGFLKNFNFTIDWESKMLHLSPISNENIQQSSFGVAFNIVNDQIKVKSLLRNSTPDQYGLQVGQSVFSINDMTIAQGLDPCALKTMITENDTLLIKVKPNDGEPIKLIRETLFR